MHGFCDFECLPLLLESKPRYRAESLTSLQNFYNKIFLMGIMSHAGKPCTQKANVGVLL